MTYEFKGSSVLIDGEWRQIRDLLHEMDGQAFAALAAAREIDHFSKSHKYCGFCGKETVYAPDEMTYARKCPDPACEGGKNYFYPSYSIASITVVSKNGGNEILLGHNAAWPENRVSLLAGFMQPGENLEECVKREIMEESGLNVSSIRYIKSQTWPFPSNIMAGFYAVADNPEEAKPDGKELDRLIWVNREQLLEIYSGKNIKGLTMPQKGSLARKLTDLWIAGQIK